MTERAPRGFTLLEVMIGLALLGLALTVLIKSAAGSIFNAEHAHMTGVVTDLARGKMYDIEEILLKDGFSDTDQSQESEECFKDEGWPNVCYSYKIEQPELPSFDELQQMATGKAEQTLAGSAGSAAALAGSGDLATTSGGGLENSALGGMLGMVGMFGGSQDIDAAAGGAMIQGQYSMFQEVLKVSVRKVTLHVRWKVLGSENDMKVVAFFTDPNAMTKTMLGGLTSALEAQGGGATGGTGGAGGTGGTGGTSGGRGNAPTPIRGGGR